MSKKTIIPAIVIILLILTLIFSSLSSIAQHPGGSDGGPEEKTGTKTITGSCSNPQVNSGGSTSAHTIDLIKETENEVTGLEITVSEIVFILSWQDEDGSD